MINLLLQQCSWCNMESTKWMLYCLSDHTLLCNTAANTCCYCCRGSYRISWVSSWRPQLPVSSESHVSVWWGQTYRNTYSICSVPHDLADWTEIEAWKWHKVAFWIRQKPCESAKKKKNWFCIEMILIASCSWPWLNNHSCSWVCLDFVRFVVCLPHRFETTSLLKSFVYPGDRDELCGGRRAHSAAAAAVDE